MFMETPKQKEKIQKGLKITNLFEDMEYHAHNDKSYEKLTQKNNHNKKEKLSPKA